MFGSAYESVPVALLHDGDLLNDLLKVRLHGDLFDCHDLSRLFVMSFKHAAVRPGDTERQS